MSGSILVDLDADDAPMPWERQVGESMAGYHAFCHVRDLKSHSLRVGAQAHRVECEQKPAQAKSPSQWRRWQVEWAWQERCRRWDAEVERLARVQLVEAQLEARERHARLAHAMLTVMRLPVQAALEAVRDATVMERLVASAKQDTQGLYQLLAAIRAMAAEIPGMVALERSALGLTDDVGLPVDAPAFDAAYETRILADPTATQLAIALVHSVAAGSGAIAALGPGPSGEPGHVGDGSASESVDAEAGGSGAAADHAPASGTAAA